MSQKTHRAVNRLYVGPERREILPGTEIGVEDIPEGQAELDRMVREGFVVERTVPLSQVMRGAPPTLKSDPGENDLGGASAPSVSQGDVVLAKKNKPVSKFAMDPDGLKGMSLDNLNIMIRERDESVPAFETEEEAIAYLSQDFEQEG